MTTRYFQSLDESNSYVNKPDIDLAEVLIIGHAIRQNRTPLASVMSQSTHEKLDGLLAGYEFGPEEYGVLCSAVYASLFEFTPDGYLEPPTARMLLECVFDEATIESKLPIVWMLTLNGFLRRALPRSGQEDMQGTGSPLDDRYVVVEEFMYYVDDYQYLKHQVYDDVPLKQRIMFFSQVGYDAERRMPQRITRPGDELTKQEWNALMHELSTYDLDYIASLRDGLEPIYQALRKHGAIDDAMIDTINSTPVFRHSVIEDAVIPFRLYLILQTIRYNFYVRSYPRWHFMRPDADPNVMRFPDISLN